jgi:hypothetical protein
MAASAVGRSFCEVDYRRTNSIGNPGAGNSPFDARGMMFFTQLLGRFGN